MIEDTLAWPGRYRRLARDLEATVAPATALLQAASVMPLAHRPGRSM